MKRSEVLQEVRKVRFEESYEGWKLGRLTQEEAAMLLGVCDRTFRRYLMSVLIIGSCCHRVDLFR